MWLCLNTKQALHRKTREFFHPLLDGITNQCLTNYSFSINGNHHNQTVHLTLGIRNKDTFLQRGPPILYPQLHTWCWTWAAPTRRKSMGLPAGTESWLCTAGKTLHPAAPWNSSIGLPWLECVWDLPFMNRMTPIFSFKINIGSELGFFHFNIFQQYTCITWPYESPLTRTLEQPLNK